MDYTGLETITKYRGKAHGSLDPQKSVELKSIYVNIHAYIISIMYINVSDDDLRLILS